MLQSREVQLVEKGLSQFSRIDYTKIFASIAKINSICLTFSLVTTYGWAIHQMDECSSQVWIVLTKLGAKNNYFKKLEDDVTSNLLLLYFYVTNWQNTLWYNKLIMVMLKMCFLIWGMKTSLYQMYFLMI